MSKTVMFIPGAWLTPASFDLFRTSYEARGYSCVAPARRLEDRPIEELRRSAHLDLHKLTIGKIVDHLECALARDHEVVVYLQVPERGVGRAGRARPAWARLSACTAAAERRRCLARIFPRSSA
jgi:hypothetical protein